MNRRQLKKNLHLLPYSKKTRNVVPKPEKITSFLENEHTSSNAKEFDRIFRNVYGSYENSPFYWSASFNLHELTKKGPYYRFVNFPVENNTLPYSSKSY